MSFDRPIHENFEFVTPRLNSAFAKLRKSGIVARKSFSCCRSCGSAELGQIVSEKDKVGYTFYSRQSKDDVKFGGGVYLNYATKNIDGEDINEKLERARTLGNTIKKFLEAEGLDVDWNGNPGQCLYVTRHPKTRTIVTNEQHSLI